MSLIFDANYDDRIYGRQALVWEDSDHDGASQEYRMAVPFQDIRTSQREQVQREESYDLSTSETIVTGSGSQEIVARVEADRYGQALNDMLRAGQRGETLSWYYDVTDPEWKYEIEVLEPKAQSDTQIGENRSALGAERNSEIRFRKTDGSEFGPEIFSGMLLQYRPGDSLRRMAFSSGDSASYTDIAGSTQTVGANVARDANYIDDEDGHKARTLLLESTNTDQLDMPYLHVPRAGSLYLRFKENGQVNSDGTHVKIGSDATSAQPAMFVESKSSVYQVRHTDGSSNVTSVADTTPSDGSFVELNVRRYSDGAVDIQQALDGGQATTGTKSSVLTFANRWSDQTARLGISNTSMPLFNFVEAPDTRSMDFMRSRR